MPPSQISREMSITYNSYKVGGDQSNRILEDVYISDVSFEKGMIEFTFTISHTSLAAFSQECLAAEAAFRTPRKDLTVLQNGQNLTKAWSQTNSYGYNAKPTIRKFGDKTDGGYARRYRVTIEAGFPADNTNTNFRRSGFINVAYSPSRRRTVTISGTYTANATTGSRAQYMAVFDSYATSVLNSLGGTYKKLEEPQGTADDQDKELNFSVTYEEILYTGVGAADSSLRGEQLTVTRSRNTPGDTPANGTVERLITLSAVYEAWFDNTVTMDLKGKWETYKGAVVNAIQGTLTGGSIGVVGEAPSFDFVNNKITVRLECVGSTTNGFLEYKETVINDIFLGNILVGVTDGRPFSKFKFTGPGKWQVTVVQDFTQISGGDPPLFIDDALTPPNDFKSTQISSHREENPVRWGLPNFAQSIDAMKTTKIRVFEFYQEPQTSVASVGGGSPAAGPGSVSTGGENPGSAGSTPTGGDNTGGAGPSDGGNGNDFEPFPPGFFSPENNGGAILGQGGSAPG